MTERMAERIDPELVRQDLQCADCGSLNHTVGHSACPTNGEEAPTMIVCEGVGQRASQPVPAVATCVMCGARVTMLEDGTAAFHLRQDVLADLREGRIR